jgi:hypothetical protein
VDWASVLTPDEHETQSGGRLRAHPGACTALARGRDGPDEWSGTGAVAPLAGSPRFG